jgi:hypothetical protein
MNIFTTKEKKEKIVKSRLGKYKAQNRPLCVPYTRTFPQITTRALHYVIFSHHPLCLAQLHNCILCFLEVVSAAKPCFLRDPVMVVSPGLLPPTDTATLYFLGRVWLLRVEPALTIERDFRRKCPVLFPFPFISHLLYR